MKFRYNEMFGALAIAIAALLVSFILAVWGSDANAQSDIKYCKNGVTGQVIVVQGIPCPSGTYQIR